MVTIKKNNDINSSISFIRLISFLMIIACHILQGLGFEAAFYINIGVQIFFFISGYLYGKKEIKNYKEFYQKRLIKVLLPLSILVLSIIFIEGTIFDKTYSLKKVIANLIGVGTFYNIIDIISNTWFVSYILICYLITPIFQKIFKETKNHFKSFFIVSIIILLFYHFKIVNINPFWIINYLLGYYYSFCEQCLKTNKITYVIIALTIIIFPLSVLLRYNIYSIADKFVYISKSYMWDIGHVLLGSLVFIILIRILNKFKIKYNKILKISDKYNYYIYLTHQIFILFDYSLLKYTNNLIINILLIITFSIISGVLLKIIVDKTVIIINKKVKKYS